MRKFFTITMLFGLMISLSGLISCEKETDKKDTDPKPPAKEWTIYVYGRPTCGYCTALKNGLDAESIAYTFYNIDAEADKKSEMWSKLNAAGMGGGSVDLPVVDVEVDHVPHIFIRPDIKDDH